MTWNYTEERKQSVVFGTGGILKLKGILLANAVHTTCYSTMG